MFLRRKEFSQDSIYGDILDAIEERAFCEGYMYAQKQFGTESKLLGFLSPGAYSGKELAKLESKDRDEYRDKRTVAAIKGHIAPFITTAKYSKALKMAERGATPEEIRREVGSATTAALAAEGILSVTTAGVTRIPGELYGYYKGISAADSKARLDAKHRTKSKWED